jgi:L-asparagine transporter-like permease
MNGRGIPLLLAMIGILSGIGLQLLIGSKLDNLDLVFASVAGMFALIVPVIASIPERKNHMQESPLYRRRMIFASAFALVLAWIVLIILAVLNDVEILRAVLGMALLSLTTCAWLISGSATANGQKKIGS